MSEIYLDHAATTKPLPIVVEKMMQIMVEDYGNPSSYHKLGMYAENHIKEASNYFANVLQCSPDEIIYTSGGTESNNMAIIGVAEAYKRIGNRIITSKIEHPSVQAPFNYLEEQGFEVIYLPVSKNGDINIDELISYIDKKTILVSIMHINNEIGTIQPIEQIGKRIKQKNKNTYFHVDAVQSFGKITIPVQKANVDLLSASGHKFYGPKGVGFLYKNKDVRLKPLVLGGGQQKGYRSGTENVPAIAAMHTAATEVISHLDQYENQIYQLKKQLAEGILNSIDNTYINGPDINQGAFHILNIGFSGIKAEVLLHALEAENIYVSSGSACASNKKVNSAILEAIGNTKAQLDEAIRFSFGIHNTQEEVEETIAKLQKIIPMLRRFSR